MDRKIKTRQVHKDIKVLDKTATVTDHVKQSYPSTISDLKKQGISASYDDKRKE